MNRIVAILASLLMILFSTSSIAIAKDYSKWLDRCSPYRAEVEQILQQLGVNKDYYYLMVAESKCTPKATSNKGAKGFWQLMPATSRSYGCHDPYDLECATMAAGKYIKDLSSRFSRFEDVIKAYNMGGRNYVRRGATMEARSLAKRVIEIKKSDEKH